MRRPAVVTTVAVLSAVLAVGCVVMAIAHSGVEVPVISRLGPGGGRPVVPAALAFALAAALLTVLTLGMWRQRPWSWAAGLVVHGVVVAGAAFPYRGWGSLAGIVLAGAAFVLLVSRPGRDGLLSTT